MKRLKRIRDTNLESDLKTQVIKTYGGCLGVNER